MPIACTKVKRIISHLSFFLNICRQTCYNGGETARCGRCCDNVHVFSKLFFSHSSLCLLGLKRERSRLLSTVCCSAATHVFARFLLFSRLLHPRGATHRRFSLFAVSISSCRNGKSFKKNKRCRKRGHCRERVSKSGRPKKSKKGSSMRALYKHAFIDSRNVPFPFPLFPRCPLRPSPFPLRSSPFPFPLPTCPFLSFSAWPLPPSPLPGVHHCT